MLMVLLLVLTKLESPILREPSLHQPYSIIDAENSDGKETLTAKRRQKKHTPNTENADIEK